VLNADGDVFEDADGNKSYGLTGQYDLGGGATVNAGIANVDGFSGLADGVLEELDGDDSFELSAQYDLGGGATVNFGARRTYDIVGLGSDEGGDAAWIGDFGISMAF
jgi:predicted porin